jgi:hypothetical protein
MLQSFRARVNTAQSPSKCQIRRQKSGTSLKSKVKHQNLKLQNIKAKTCPLGQGGPSAYNRAPQELFFLANDPSFVYVNTL